MTTFSRIKPTLKLLAELIIKEASILKKYAAEKEFQLTKFPADWKSYGKAAGPKRNEQMANYADTLIAFWDGESKGTKHMIYLAKKENVKIIIIYF